MPYCGQCLNTGDSYCLGHTRRAWMNVQSPCDTTDGSTCRLVRPQLLCRKVGTNIGG